MGMSKKLKYDLDSHRRQIDLLNATPEKLEHIRKGKRDYYYRLLARESEAGRRKRLDAHNKRCSKKRINETLEDREIRLAKGRENYQIQKANETIEQREKRLNKIKQRPFKSQSGRTKKLRTELSESELETTRALGREAYKRRCEDPSFKEYHNNKSKERNRNRTQEQVVADSIYQRQYKGNRTPEQIKVIKKREKLRRLNMTPEQRKKKNEDNKLYRENQKLIRLSSETPTELKVRRLYEKTQRDKLKTKRKSETPTELKTRRVKEKEYRLRFRLKHGVSP